MPSPQIPLIDLARIQSRLAGRQRSWFFISLCQIVIGLGLSLVGPIIMTGFVWFTFLLWGNWLSLGTVFGIAVAIMIPLQYWTEYRTRGNFLSGSVGEGTTVGTESLWLASMLTLEFDLSNSTTSLATTDGASPAGLVELMLWGPRQVISGFAKLRVGRKFARTDRPRAALLLQTLLTKPRGEPVKTLLQKGEKPPDLTLPLGYLAYFDWAGVAESGDRAWALTETRHEFESASR